MSDVLQKICADKRDHIANAMAQRPIRDVQDAAKLQSPTRGFVSALETKVANGGYGLIAELKKASPSKGLIRDDFEPRMLAQAYATGGAACLSVLTDVPYFQGHDSYLIEARDAVEIPVLRKDFMLDPYQIIESRALGADCILLIMAALSDDQAMELETLAMEHGMDVLIEVHDEQELHRALKLRSPLLGVNNRNLKTLEVDLATTERLARLIPDDRILVCESGLYSREDLDRMADHGAFCFLIGESLMRNNDVAAATSSLLSPNHVAAHG